MPCDFRVKGYEPKPTRLAMRSHSVPSRGTDLPTAAVNPFYSEKTQEECKLAAARPLGLPSDYEGMDPLQTCLGALRVMRKLDRLERAAGVLQLGCWGLCCNLRRCLAR